MPASNGKAHRLLSNMLSYFSGFFVVSLFLMVALVVSYDNVRDSVSRELSMSLESGISRLEDIGGRMRMLDGMIVQDSVFSALRYQEDEEDDVSGLRMLNELYRSLGIIADDVDYIFTIFRNNDVFVSSGLVSMDFPSYYGRFMTAVDDERLIPDSESVKDFLSSAVSQGRRYLTLDSLTIDDGSFLKTFHDPLVILSADALFNIQPLYVTAYVIDSQRLEELLTPEQAMGSSSIRVSLLDGGTVLLDTADGDEGSAFTFSQQSQALGLSVTLTVDEDLVLSQMWQLIWMLATVIVGGLLSGLVIALYYALRHYRGFTRIRQVLEGGDVKPVRGRDFADVHERILRLRREGESYKERVGEVEKRNRAIEFENVLTRGARTDEERGILDALRPYVANGGAVVVLLRFIDYGDAPLDILFDMLSTSAWNDYLTVHSGSRDEIFLIALGKNGPEGLEDFFKDYTTRVPDSLVHIGISPPSGSVDQLGMLYDKALRAVSSLFADDGRSLVLSYDDKMRTSLLEVFNTESMGRLRNLLLRGRADDASVFIDSLFDAFASFPLEAEERKAQVYHMLSNVIQDAWTAMGGPEGEVVPYRREMTRDEMKDIMKAAVHQLCDYTQGRLRSHNDELLETILSIVERRYSEPGLSAYAVSQEAGVSEKYLQSFFREHMGEGFSQYLLNFRLEKARALLETSDLPNEKIAELTGFGALNTFYRNFSKSYGVTPRVYKEGLKRT